MKFFLIILFIFLIAIFIILKISINIFRYKRNMPLEKNIFGKFVNKLMKNKNKML